MRQRISRRKYKIFAMDLETHNDPESMARRETSAWLGCFIDESSDIDDEASYFYSVGEFLDRLEREATRKPRRKASESVECFNVCVYIFNLSFEWSFILPVLLERGFHFSPIIDKEDEYAYTTVSTKSVSSVWQVEIKFGKKCGRVLLRDLSKIFSGSLAAVAKSFGLQTQKGEIDYRKNRLYGPDGKRGGYVPTKEEKEYCFKDTKIIVEILQKMEAIKDRDFWNSISMASYSCRKMIRAGWPRKYRPYMEFRKRYPELGEEETEFLRHSVAGGITYAVDRFQFKDIKGDIGHIDLHQAHPSSLYWKTFPCGVGTYYKGRPKPGRICCCHVRVSYDFVKLHSVIALIGTSCITDKELWVWNFEIPTMEKCYENLRVEYIDGYSYEMHPLPWRSYYQENYAKRQIAKANEDAFFTMYYKLLNNSSYGKLLERPHAKTFHNYVREDGIIDSLIEDNPNATGNAKYTYIPVGSCCPAYTRCTLVEAALTLGWRNVLYFDTDSIFFIKNKESMAGVAKLDMEDHLGGWGWEDDLTRAQFTAPKRYKTKSTEGKVEIKAGGINFDEYIATVHKDEVQALIDQGLTEREAVQSIPLDYEEVNIVSSSWKVKRAFRCRGGTIIDFQPKEMKVPDKYLDIFNANKDN